MKGGDMLVYEIIEACRSVLLILDSAGASVSDVHYLAMYEEYTAMRQKRFKVRYIAGVLSAKYGITERRFYKVVRLFEKEVQPNSNYSETK